MLAGKHVFCEKPLAHSCAEAREIRELGRQSKLATQLGSQGGSTDTFRRSMEVIQAGLLGKIREVHCWITRSFPPSAPIDTNADPIPEGLNWDFWCGPSPLLPYKNYYIAAPGGGLPALGPLAGVRRRPPGRHGRPRPEPALAGVEARRAGAGVGHDPRAAQGQLSLGHATSAGTSPPGKASTR